MINLMYKNKNIQKLVDELDIVEVISEYVVLKKSGSNYKGLSPFKEENTPSFVVSPSKNIYKDFGSGIGGDVISFYMRINNMTFIEAVNELSRKYNIEIDKINVDGVNNSKNFKLYEIIKESQDYFNRTILSNKEAISYMENRGYTIEEIKKYNIGFAEDKWDNLYNYLKAKGYLEEDLLELGLIKKNENGNIFDYFRNRIMFPIYNDSMKIVGFGGRIIKNDKEAPKYLNSPDSKIFKKGNELFGLLNRGENIRKKGLAILMEGYLDVLTAQKHGFYNAVASLGTSFTDEQAQLLKKYTQNIVIAYDNDTAGKMATIKAGNILKKNDFDIRCLSIGDMDTKDPDEYLKKYGKKSFFELLKTSKNIFDFLYEEFSYDLNLNDYTGKNQMINRFREFFSNVNSKTELNLYIQKLSVELNIDKEALYEEFSFKKLKNNNFFYKKNWNRKKEKVISKATELEKYDKLEKETLKYLLKYGQSKDKKINKHCSNFKNKNIENLIYKDIFEKLMKVNFNVENNGDLIIQEEEKEIILTLKLEADIEIQDEEKRYKNIFADWFRKELDYLKKKINKKDPLNIKIERIKSDLKIIHSISEIESLYSDFKSEVDESVRK